MRMKALVSAVAVLAVFPVWASQPGQPLDCSDWVFLEPGYSCTLFGILTNTDSLFMSVGGQKEIDNQGNLYVLRRYLVEGTVCSTCPRPRYRTELVRSNGQAETVLAYIDDRHGTENTIDLIRPRGSYCTGGAGRNGNCQYVDGVTELLNTLTFDDKNGRMLIPLESRCTQYDPYSGPGCTYNGGYWMGAVTGFATTFEILQTYTPTSSELRFRVPYMPAGLRSADRFDTYWGKLSDLPDFTRAQPVRCDYPATPPGVGDYLTVPETSPLPSPSQGNYIITVVTYGSQRRYGRKLIGGVLNGRDPALLPACP